MMSKLLFALTCLHAAALAPHQRNGLKKLSTQQSSVALVAKSGVLACSLAALLPTVALALSASDYDSLYGASAGTSSFSIDKISEKPLERSKPKESASSFVEVPQKAEPIKKEAPRVQAAPKVVAKVAAPVAKVEAPKVDVPATSFTMPTFDAPKLDLPKFEAPKFDIPATPKFEAPKFDIPATPKFDMPKFDIPATPKFDAPKIDAPKFVAPATPKFDIPKEVKSAPPKPAAPAKPEKVYSPQEDRDADARGAASVYRAADDEAKVLEQQAKGLRQAANDKKKLAGQAKDEACETRPGGKLLCIRGFGSGY